MRTKQGVHSIVRAAVLLATAAALVAAEPKPVLVAEPPAFGTFYSLTLKLPPYPFNPFPELPAYSTGSGALIYDDSSVDYAQLWAELAVLAAVVQAAEETSGPGMMALSEPPPSPGEGGGSGGSVTNPPAYSVPGLKLTIPLLANGAVYTSLMEADTNSAYDLFEQFVLKTNLAWSRIAATEIGGTNFAVSQVSPTNAYYRAADTTDSDFDSLSDAYEQFVTRTNPLDPDSDHDGLPDGREDANVNGLPDAVDYRRLNRAVIFASRTNAYEGSQSGELTILLPAPAPTNGTTLTLHLGGYTDYGLDYMLTTTTGVAVTNDVVFAAGQTQVKLNVNAVDDTVQRQAGRRVQARLAGAANFPLDPELAEVTLVDNDRPILSLIANDSEAREPAGTSYNRGEITLIREGDLSIPLTFNVFAQVTGSASSGGDYPSIDQFVEFPADVDRVVKTIEPLADGVFEGEEDIVLTLFDQPFYSINPLAASARVVIKDADRPVVSLEGTDLLATEYNLKAATVTVRRTGSTEQPLSVRLAVGGTATGGYATNGADYEVISDTIKIPTGASTTTFQIRPLSDTNVEPVETITGTIKGSLAYTIGSSNSVRVLLDDNNPTQYQLAYLKATSVYWPFPGEIDSPAVFEVRRLGRSSGATNIPFVVYTNQAQSRTLAYRACGDVASGSPPTNVAFGAFATRARLNLTSPNYGFNTYSNGSFQVAFPTIGPSFSTVWFLPPWMFVKLTVAATNAIEGTTTNARLSISRTWANAPAAPVNLRLSGAATPPGGPNPADHNLPVLFTLTLPAGGLLAETNLTALTDAVAEGWETVIVTPDHGQNNVSVELRPPQFAFLGDNVPDPSSNGGTDTDGDGMLDQWEVARGLDPLDPVDGQLDPDKDGLTNLEETFQNTNPTIADTDNDNANDFQETTQGSNPLDVADEGQPPPASELLPVRIRLGDHSGSHSEQYQLNVGPIRFENHDAGTLDEAVFQLRRGQSYPIRLIHRRTTLPVSDYDYTAQILPEPTNSPAGFVLEDPEGLLGVYFDDTNYIHATATLIVPKIEVAWEDVPNSGVLETNPAPGGGYRFYPDQQSPTDTTDRRRLFVRVKTMPPLAGQVVRLKSLDVDDPTPLTDDPHLIIDDTDGLGFQSGEDNRSTPRPGDLQDIVLTLDVLGEAVTFFTVNLQPGDNYRVAAVLDTPGASNHLDSLQVSAPFSERYVAASDAPALGFVGALSPMLTVWRKLHLEFDSMTAPPTSGPQAIFDTVTITRFDPNWPDIGKSRLKLLHPAGVQGNSLYERGQLDISGAGIFPITNSTTELADGARVFTTVEIDGVPATNVFNLGAKLYDDDDQYLWNDPLYPSLLALQTPPLPATNYAASFIQAAAPRFAAAYITLSNANAVGWNTQPLISFKRHAPASFRFMGNVFSDFDDGNLQLKGKDRPEFWAYSVAFGYQSTRNEDGEDNREEPLAGETDKKQIGSGSLGFSVVWMNLFANACSALGRV